MTSDDAYTAVLYGDELEAVGYDIRVRYLPGNTPHPVLTHAGFTYQLVGSTDGVDDSFDYDHPVPAD
ncbi:hypothetical protein [Microterricola viridarii]|uniref:Uncharacterized protein n=1 Tax=Microterricola viridarii TaxID=412690 RepID=A0A0X8E5E3_9MICO|nr:hypothetical protein [Microterricola viridarii]AMB59376.1 hypothetical protein AWU67_11465 [Microterricola viridarii]